MAKGVIDALTGTVEISKSEYASLIGANKEYDILKQYIYEMHKINKKATIEEVRGVLAVVECNYDG